MHDQIILFHIPDDVVSTPESRIMLVVVGYVLQ